MPGFSRITEKACMEQRLYIYDVNPHSLVIRLLYCMSMMPNDAMQIRSRLGHVAETYFFCTRQ